MILITNSNSETLFTSPALKCLTSPEIHFTLKFPLPVKNSRCTVTRHLKCNKNWIKYTKVIAGTAAISEGLIMLCWKDVQRRDIKITLITNKRWFLSWHIIIAFELSTLIPRCTTYALATLNFRFVSGMLPSCPASVPCPPPPPLFFCFIIICSLVMILFICDRKHVPTFQHGQLNTVNQCEHVHFGLWYMWELSPSCTICFLMWSAMWELSPSCTICFMFPALHFLRMHLQSRITRHSVYCVPYMSVWWYMRRKGWSLRWWYIIMIKLWLIHYIDLNKESERKTHDCGLQLIMAALPVE